METSAWESRTVEKKRWTLEYADLGTDPVPIEPCIAPEYFALERERVFRRVWLNVGREEQLPKPGDYFVKDLPVCRTSLLVVRGKDGAVRAFHNMCSHRGNKLVWHGHGTCQALACKVHGWTYSLEGRLTFVPDEDFFFHLNQPLTRRRITYGHADILARSRTDCRRVQHRQTPPRATGARRQSHQTAAQTVCH